MRKLNINDETYAAWEALAAARGLTIEQWLEETLGARSENGRTPQDLSPAERVERMQAFWNEVPGRGGKVIVDREDLYG